MGHQWHGHAILSPEAGDNRDQRTIEKTVIISRLLLLPSFRVNTAPFADAKVPFGVLYDLFVVFYLALKEIFV